MWTKKDIKIGDSEFIHLDKSVPVKYQCLVCGGKRTLRFNYKDADTGQLWRYVKYKAMIPYGVKIKCSKCNGLMSME